MRGLVLSALLAVIAACTGRQIDMAEQQPGDNDYGRAALLAAVEAHAAKPPSPETFRAFALAIDELRPRFDAEVGGLAELYLAFSALPVIEQVVELPRGQQLEALALTVFPTAFGLQPKPGETARAYLLRLCGQEQPLECKDYVPEGWPVVLSAKVRRNLKSRARQALSTCRVCANEETYEEILRSFSDKVAKEDAHAALNKGKYLPDKWPTAAGAAAPWSGAPVFSMDGDGDARFDGEALPTGSWHASLKKARDGGKVLGVHLRPDERVGVLRAVARDAAKAGYSELALQVRVHGFPYELREYRIGLRGGGRRVNVRDVDTIQIAARALDAMHHRGQASPRL